MTRNYYVICLLVGFATGTIASNNGTVRSRHKRYLVFPEGSSFQVVFDLTYPSVAIQGNVFVFGHTAALAYELPDKPIFLDKKKLDKVQESGDSTTPLPLNFEYYDDWQPPLAWNYQDEAPAHWHQPAFDRRRSLKKRSLAKSVHRRSTRELYGKIEKLLSALSKDGKSCLLKAICQARQLPSEKGNLWQEIVRAIFRAKDDAYPHDEDEYDRASNRKHDCEERYPECDGHVLSNLFRNRMTK